MKNNYTNKFNLVNYDRFIGVQESISGEKLNILTPKSDQKEPF